MIILQSRAENGMERDVIRREGKGRSGRRKGEHAGGEREEQNKSFTSSAVKLHPPPPFPCLLFFFFLPPPPLLLLLIILIAIFADLTSLNLCSLIDGFSSNRTQVSALGRPGRGMTAVAMTAGRPGRGGREAE
eukprot:316317-Hanusia_phi.AAC.1